MISPQNGQILGQSDWHASRLWLLKSQSTCPPDFTSSCLRSGSCVDADQVWIRSTPNRPVGSACRLRKGPAGAPLQPVPGHAASCATPPALHGSHRLTCVTDPGQEGWRTAREEGARARTRPLLAASLSSSLATGRRPSPAGGALIGEKRTSRPRRAE